MAEKSLTIDSERSVSYFLNDSYDLLVLISFQRKPDSSVSSDQSALRNRDIFVFAGLNRIYAHAGIGQLIRRIFELRKDSSIRRFSSARWRFPSSCTVHRLRAGTCILHCENGTCFSQL